MGMTSKVQSCRGSAYTTSTANMRPRTAMKTILFKSKKIRTADSPNASGVRKKTFTRAVNQTTVSLPCQISMRSSPQIIESKIDSMERLVARPCEVLVFWTKTYVAPWKYLWREVIHLDSPMSIANHPSLQTISYNTSWSNFQQCILRPHPPVQRRAC